MQKGFGKARMAAARKLGIRLWIMMRDEIDYVEFCRRGQLRQQSGGAACAGMPPRDSGLADRRSDRATCSLLRGREFEEVIIVVVRERRHVW